MITLLNSQRKTVDVNQISKFPYRIIAYWHDLFIQWFLCYTAIANVISRFNIGLFAQISSLDPQQIGVNF